MANVFDKSNEVAPAIHAVTVKVTETRAHPPASAPIVAPISAPWYTEVLERFPCDPEQRVFLTEQLTGALAWGGDDHMIRIPQGLFMAMMQDLRRDHSVPAETPN